MGSLHASGAAGMEEGLGWAGGTKVTEGHGLGQGVVEKEGKQDRPWAEKGQAEEEAPRAAGKRGSGAARNPQRGHWRKGV